MRSFASRCLAVFLALALIAGTGFRDEAHGTMPMSGHECCDHMNDGDHHAGKSQHKADNAPCCVSGLGCSTLASLPAAPLVDSEPAFTVTVAFYTERQTHSAGIEPNPSLDPPRPSA
jgi:hypothetical protein